MNIAVWNWHTPYLFLLARALPERRFLALPTLCAPSGWDEQQRPRPPNVALGGALADADVALAQTAYDLGLLLNMIRPIIYLAHNQAKYDTGGMTMAAVRSLPVVAISEMKAQSWRDRRYRSPITVILPYVSLEDYGGWRGDGGSVLTVANGLARPLFDRALWRQATEGLPVRLVGSHNEGIPGAVGPATSWEALKEEYCRACVYLSVNTWPEEDGYNLAWLEAAATGCPLVTLENPTAPNIGYHAETVTDLRTRLGYFLERRDGKRPMKERRRAVAECFPLTAFQERWRRVLEEAVR